MAAARLRVAYNGIEVPTQAWKNPIASRHCSFTVHNNQKSTSVIDQAISRETQGM
jgi:hypothetical protein